MERIFKNKAVIVTFCLMLLVCFCALIFTQISPSTAEASVTAPTYNPTPKYTVLDGAYSNENYDNLFDGKLSTKYCIKIENDPYVVVKSSSYGTIITGYNLKTANDTATHSGRNPKDWVLYGSNDYNESDNSGTWTAIQTITNDETLGAENYKSYSFEVSNASPYKYFKFAFTARRGAEEDDMGSWIDTNIQLSEIEINSDVMTISQDYLREHSSPDFEGMASALTPAYDGNYDTYIGDEICTLSLNITPDMSGVVLYGVAFHLYEVPDSAEDTLEYFGGQWINYRENVVGQGYTRFTTKQPATISADGKVYTVYIDNSSPHYQYEIHNNKTPYDAGIKIAEVEFLYHFACEHSFTGDYVERTESQCNSEGNRKYRTCAYGCGAAEYYDDSNTLQTCEVHDFQNKVIIPCLPHTGTWEDATTAECCYQGNYKYRECLSCGVYEYIVDGKAYTCQLAEKPTKIIIPPTGEHDWSTTEIIPQEDATCTEMGTKAHWHCNTSGRNYDSDKTTWLSDLSIPAIGHSYGDWTAPTAPTCTAYGNYAYRQCSISTCSSYQYITDLSITDYDAYVIANGEDIGNCAQADYNTYIRRDKLDHTWSTTEIIPQVDATCTETGTKAYWHCNDCGNNYDGKGTQLTDLTINALGHSYGDWNDALSPTCTTDGNYKYSQCSTCSGYKYEKDGVVLTCTSTQFDSVIKIPASHTYGTWTNALSPTCTTAGNNKYCQCSVCSGYKFEMDGREYTCSSSDFDNQIKLDATGHSYGNWVNEVASGCTSLGHLKYRQCITTGCKIYEYVNAEGETLTCAENEYDTYIRILPSHDYDYDNWTSDDTQHWHACKREGCTAKEGTRYHDYFADCVATCGSCGYVRSESELVHTKDTYSWFYDSTNHWHRCKASIAQEGEQLITCSAQLDKAGHTYENGRYYESNGKHYNKCDTCDYYDPSTETPCDNEMKYDDYHHYNECKVCHTYSSIVDHVFSSDCDASCNTEGCNYVRTTYIDHATSSWYKDDTNHWKVCSRCNGEYAKEAHTLVGNYGKDSHFLNCEDCGYRTQVESHSYDDTEDPVCNGCSYIRTVYINSLSFEYSGYTLNDSIFDFSTTISTNSDKVKWSSNYNEVWGIALGTEDEVKEGECYWVEDWYDDGYSYFMPNTDYWLYIFIESEENESGSSLYSLDHLNTNNITLKGDVAPSYIFDWSYGVMLFFKLPKLEGTSSIQQMPAIDLTMSGHVEDSSVYDLQFNIKESSDFIFDSLDIEYSVYINSVYSSSSSGAKFNTTDFYGVSIYIYNEENYTFLGYDANNFTVEGLGQAVDFYVHKTGGYIEAYYRLPSLLGEHECDFQWKNTLENIHYKECTLCYAIQEETEEEHVYDNAFDRTCETCGYTRKIDIPYLKLNLTGYALDEPTGDMTLTLDPEILGVDSNYLRFVLTTDPYSFEMPSIWVPNSTFIWGDGYFMPNTEYWLVVHAYSTDGYSIERLQAENVYVNDNYCTASLCYYYNQQSNIFIKLPELEGESSIATVPEIGELSISGYTVGGNAGNIDVNASQVPIGIKPTNSSSGLLTESRLFYKDSYKMKRILEQFFIADGSYGDLLPEDIISAEVDYYLAVLMLPDTGYTFYGFDEKDVSIAGFGNPIDILLGNGGEYVLMLFNAPTLTVAEHEHSYSSNYSFNTTNHWKNCEDCSEKSEYTEHVFDGDNLLQCTVCNQVISRIISLDLEFSGYVAGNYATDLVVTADERLYVNFRGYGALYGLFDNKIDIIKNGLFANCLPGRYVLDLHTTYYLAYTLYPIDNSLDLSLSPENITLGDFGNPIAIVNNTSDPTDVNYRIYFELPTLHTHTKGLYYNEEVDGVHYHYVKCDECDYYYQDTKTACDANGLFAGDTTHNACCSICNSINDSVGVAHTFNIANYDDNYHWSECSCGKVGSSTLVAHNYNQIKKDDDKHWNECSCGKVDSSSITAHSWTANHDDLQHWQECTCGEIKDAVNHSIATGTITCSNCSFSLTVVDSMTFTVDGYGLDGNMRDFEVTLSNSTVGVSSTFNAYITIKYEKAVENVEYIILADNEYAYFLPGVQYWAWIVVDTASAKYTFNGITKDDITVNGAQVVDCYTDSSDTTACIGVRLPDIGGNTSIEDVSAMNFTMTGYAEGANCSDISVTLPSNANVTINATALFGNDTTFDKTKQYYLGVEIFAKENYTLLSFDASMATINGSIPCMGIEGIASHGSCILFFKLPSLYEAHDHVAVDTWQPTVDGSKHFSYCSICSEKTDPTDHVYSEDSPYVCTLCGHENYTQVNNFSFTLTGYEVDALIKDTAIAISGGCEGFTITSGSYYQGFTIMNRTSNKDYSTSNTYFENTTSFFMPGILYTVKLEISISEGYVCDNLNLNNITLNGISASNGGYFNNSQSSILAFFDLPIITAQSEKTIIEPEFEIEGYTIGGAYNAFNVTTSYAGIDSTNLDIRLVKHMGGDLNLESSTLFESYDAFKLELTIRPIEGYTIAGMDEDSITFTDPSKILRFERYYYNTLYEAVTYVWYLKHLNPDHTHTYTLSYWDDNNHWMECPSCHAPNTPEPHTFTEDNPYECTGCSYTRMYSVTATNITLDGFTIGSKYSDIQISNAMIGESVLAMAVVETYFATSQDVLEDDFSSVIFNTTYYRFLDSTIDYYLIMVLRYNQNLDFSQLTMNGITINGTIAPSRFIADYTGNGEFCFVIFDLGNLAVDHIHGGNWVAEDPATCTDTGVKGHYDCTICGKHFDENDIEIIDLIIPALGHDCGEWQLEVPSSCCDNGTKGHKTCSACGLHFDNSGNVIESLTLPLDGDNHTNISFVEKVVEGCTTDGVKAHYKCDGCDAKFEDEEGLNEISNFDSWKVIPASHKLGEWQAEIPATCVKTGTKGHKTCSVCNLHFDNEGNLITSLVLNVNADNHEGSLMDGWQKDSTYHWKEYSCCHAQIDKVAHTPDREEATESDPVKCTECQYIIEPTKEHVHVISFVAKVDEGCTTNGVKAHYACLGCSDKFEDEEGTKLISDFDTWKVIPASHKLGEWITETPSTCCNTGTKAHYTCSVCSKNFNANGNELDITIAIDSSKHTTISFVKKVDADCTTDGVKAHYECEGCHAKFEDEEGSKLISNFDSWKVIPASHTFGEWQLEVPANCINTGTKAHKTCSVCNLHFDNSGNVIESLTLPLDGDNHINISFVAKVNEGCTTNGVKAYYECDGCDVKFEDEEGLNVISDFDTWKIIPASHKFGEWQAEIPATCCDTGVKGYKTCSACHNKFNTNGDLITDLTIAINPDNHEGSLLTDLQSNATHHWKEYSCCHAQIEKVEHTPNIEEATESDPVKCTKCDYIITPVKGHTHVLTLVDKVNEGCTTNGTKAYYACSGCSDKFEDAEGTKLISDFDTWKVIPASHKLGEWIAEVPATCCTPGVAGHKTCSVCNFNFDNNGAKLATLVIPVDGNNHEGALSDTLLLDATHHWKEYTCCHAVAEKVEHSFGDLSLETTATCCSTGVMAHKTCSVCNVKVGSDGKIIKDVTIPVNGNNHTNISFVAKVDEGCTTDGVKAYYKCDGCDVKFEDENGTIVIADFATWSVIPATHKLGEWIAEVPATCSSIGSKAHFTCSVCNKDFNASGNELDITIAVDSNKHTTISFVEKVNESCVADGIKAYYECDGCRAKFENKEGTQLISNFDSWKVIPATHKLGEWIAEVPATCCDSGTRGHYTCSVCNKNFDDKGVEITDLTIAINGNHSLLQLVEEVKATTTSEGNIAYYYCNGCNKYFSDEDGENEITAQSVIIPKLPEIIDHDHEWEKGDDDEGLSFKIRADFALFVALYVDGEEVSSESYEIDENESEIRLKASFLNALSCGEHTIKVSFSNGDVQTTFFIEEKEDDSISAGAWTGIGIAIAVVVAVIVLAVILGIKGKLKGVLLTIKEFFKKIIQKIKSLFGGKKDKKSLEPSDEGSADSDTEKE